MQFSSILISLVWLSVVSSSEVVGSEAEHPPLLNRTKRQWSLFRAIAAAPLAGANLAEQTYRGVTNGIVNLARGRKRRDTTNDEETLLDLVSSLDDAPNDEPSLDRKKRQLGFIRALASAPLAGLNLAEQSYRGVTNGIINLARGRKRRDTSNDEETLLDLLSSLDNAPNDEPSLDRKKRQFGFIRALASAPLAGLNLAEQSYRGVTNGIVNLARGRKRRDTTNDEETLLDLLSSLDDAPNDEPSLDRKKREYNSLPGSIAYWPTYQPLAGGLSESSYGGLTDGIVDYARGRKKRDSTTASDEEKAFLDIVPSLNSYLEATRSGRKGELESVLGWVESVVEEAFLAGAIAARDSYRGANYEEMVEDGDTSQAVKEEVELIAEPLESGQ